MTTSPQYYNEIVVDPLSIDRTKYVHHEVRGWRLNLAPLTTQWRHVDDHAL